jgi:hypothetical protein
MTSGLDFCGFSAKLGITPPRDKAWAAFHCLLCAGMGGNRDEVLHAYSGVAAVPVLTGKTELKTLGWKVVVDSTRQRYPLPDTIVEQRQQLLQSVPTPANGLRWLTSRHGVFTIPHSARDAWTALTTATYAAMAPELRAFWSTFPWAGNAWITGPTGEILHRHHFRSVCITHLHELQLEHDGAFSFRFGRPTSGQRTPTGDRMHQLSSWVWTIIVNTGLFLADPTATTNDRVYACVCVVY